MFRRPAESWGRFLRFPQIGRETHRVAAIARLFPDAVVCMESALLYYGYTDRTPGTWCLVVDKHSTKSRYNIDYPKVKPFYIPKEQMLLGVETVMIEKTEIKIFNRERLICDCLRQENKMDAEIATCAILWSKRSKPPPLWKVPNPSPWPQVIR